MLKKKEFIQGILMNHSFVSFLGHCMIVAITFILRNLLALMNFHYPTLISIQNEIEAENCDSIWEKILQLVIWYLRFLKKFMQKEKKQVAIYSGESYNLGVHPNSTLTNPEYLDKSDLWENLRKNYLPIKVLIS